MLVCLSLLTLSLCLCVITRSNVGLGYSEPIAVLRLVSSILSPSPIPNGASTYMF